MKKFAQYIAFFFGVVTIIATSQMQYGQDALYNVSSDCPGFQSQGILKFKSGEVTEESEPVSFGFPTRNFTVSKDAMLNSSPARVCRGVIVMQQVLFACYDGEKLACTILLEEAPDSEEF